MPLWNPKRGCLFGRCSIKNAQLNRTLVVHFVGAYHRCELEISSRNGFLFRFAICLQLMRLIFLQPSMGAAHVLLCFLLRASFSLFFFDSPIRSL